LYIDPVEWADIGDAEHEQAVVHSHPSSQPRPSRTDVENIGLWEGRPYLIYSVREDELAAWTIQSGEIAPLDLG
jgi:proteasome lid subunit RPN8/RPN11